MLEKYVSICATKTLNICKSNLCRDLPHILFFKLYLYPIFKAQFVLGVIKIIVSCLCNRCSEWGPHRSWRAAAAATALQPDPGGTGHPGGHGLEQHGRRVLQGPELHRQPPAKARAERRERG